jgi:hypothetical protein
MLQYAHNLGLAKSADFYIEPTCLFRQANSLKPINFREDYHYPLKLRILNIPSHDIHRPPPARFHDCQHTLAARHQILGGSDAE